TVTRQSQTDDRPAPRLTLDIDCAAVLFDNLPCHRQTQTVAGRFRIDVGTAIKSLEHTWQILGRNAAPLIAHAEYRLIGPLSPHDRHTDLDFRTERTVLQRIVEEIGQHARQPRLVP